MGQVCLKCGNTEWKLLSELTISVQPGSREDCWACSGCLLPLGRPGDAAVVGVKPTTPVKIERVFYQSLRAESFTERLRNEAFEALKKAADQAIEQVIEGCTASFSRRSCLSLIARTLDLAWQERWQEALEVAELAVAELKGKIDRQHFGPETP